MAAFSIENSIENAAISIDTVALQVLDALRKNRPVRKQSKIVENQSEISRKSVENRSNRTLKLGTCGVDRPVATITTPQRYSEPLIFPELAPAAFSAQLPSASLRFPFKSPF